MRSDAILGAFFTLVLAGCTRSADTAAEQTVPYRAAATTSSVPTSATPTASAPPAASAPAATSSVAATVSPSDADELRLERTACYGACPVYTVTVRANGDVAFDGRAFVRVFGPASRKVPATRARALVDRAQAAGFFGWKDAYEFPVTDHPTTKITATIGGRTKTISEYAACGSDPAFSKLEAAPPALCALEKEIDAVSGADGWTTCVGAAGKEAPCPRSAGR
jgi:hypothetical protein